MVRMDWERILSIKAESLTDDEIEDLFPMVIRCDTDSVESIHHLRALMKLSQEMLQHKDNQVESLLLECDELKEKVASALSSSAKMHKIPSQVTASEEFVRDTSDFRQRDFSGDDYQDTVKKKNDKIMALMQELTTMEKENEELKLKLEILRNEMEDATENMDAMTLELQDHQRKSVLYKDKILELQRENSTFLNQIEELGSHEQEKDRAITDFGEAIESKVAEWKYMLDERDAEISRLREELSYSLTQSVRTVREQSKSQIHHLNQEIDQREGIISKLQTKLIEATAEINESAELIEKLKTDAKKLSKSGRRKEQRELLIKIQEANERISILQVSLRQAEEEATLKSEQLCETLINLRKYEEKEKGLADTIKEVKSLKEQLRSKSKHVQDLINVINNLEALNSTREMQILALREKLGMLDDEEVNIDGVLLKSQEETRVRNELVKKNEVLMQDNLELQSDMRVLRYKLRQMGDKFGNSDVIDASGDHSTTRQGSEGEISAIKVKIELDEVRENLRLVVEENEALRKGMHEILDSIRDQDGKSSVDVHSGTLEKLLEALDVRHLAGWYHPAMRLQERLNVVQGSNAELRSQLKHTRKELEKKDKLLQKHSSSTSRATPKNPTSSDSETEEAKIYIAEIERIQDSYRNELKNWQEERESLDTENNELRDTVEKLTAQFEAIEKDLKTIENGEDRVKAAFATKSRECAESAVQLIVANRKCTTLESLLNGESAKSYRIRKEAIDLENRLRKSLADSDKRNKILETEISSLSSNLSNSVSRIEFEELREKLEEANLNLRGALELKMALEAPQDDFSRVDKMESTNLETLHEISQLKLSKCESSLRRVTEINKELREQMVVLQKELSRQMRPQKLEREEKIEDKEALEKKIQVLEIERENLQRSLEISKQEAQTHCTTNSLKIFELDSLRHQILDLHAVSEDKETIARLGFELNNCKANEIESNRRKVQLENEVVCLKEDLRESNRKLDETRSMLQDCRKICSARCSSYEEAIDFLRTQYAGSTSISALRRYEAMLKNLEENRGKIESNVKEANELMESAKTQQMLLTDRLAIVQRLKDILEQQIGTPNVENLMQNFSEKSQYTLNDIRLKRRITQLESELRLATHKLSECRSAIMSTEYEMLNVQRIWSRTEETPSVSAPRIETRVATEKKSVLVEASVETRSVEVQSEAITSKSPPEAPISSPKRIAAPVDASRDARASILEEQLNQALALASERSAILIKYESKMAECEGKVIALERSIAEKDSQLKTVLQSKADAKRTEILEDLEEKRPESGDKMALRSMIESLRKMAAQKEETLTRYQNLLKEEREEHAKAASRFQDEIRELKEEIKRLKREVEAKEEKLSIEEPPRDPKSGDVEAQEKMARLCERASTFEAELHIAKELGERWHRLAEERLQHMDRMRERLEEQHKNELESYRLESNKWQTEADALRQRLSENRMQLAKGNISMVKELQERDNKIQELNVAYQQLQSEFEMMERMTMSQPMVVHKNCANKMQEMVESLGRDQSSHYQNELEMLRRQLKAQNEKEKAYKDQIAELKQQISRRYMAVKSEERRASNRETQLERKLKTLEEELEKARIQLDREYRVQEAKRVKTAEELSLWEKQKKFQQQAEKLKKELKEKNAELRKSNANYEKLRAAVSCMEREKWYLRSKLRSETGSLSGVPSSANGLQFKIVENLQIECQTLRDRVKELTDRLESEDNRELHLKLEQQRGRIEALAAVTEGNGFVIEQLEKLEAAKTNLEKANIRLESENFELKMKIEKTNLDTPRLREKVEHLEKYVELLKVEKSSESSPRSSEKDLPESKRNVAELEKTVFILKRVVEKLQAENKRLKVASTNGHRVSKSRTVNAEGASPTRRQYEQAQKRVVALEADLQLAEQRIVMLENARKEEDTSGEIGVLRQQLAHKSELLDKVKQLLTRAAINEKALRQRIQQLEMKQTLSTISECSLSPSHKD